ncbi:hypothetical protein C8R44DRAFT_822455 [Mycena epipterygia]|nr:hypothetical protein C8R44DRAFT_822455 [Mycena epipterygia]
MSDSDQWAVFLTATSATVKTANRALLLIQGFEFSEYLCDSSWTLFTSAELPSMAPPPTSAPLTEDQSNAFAGKSLADVNAFMRANCKRLADMGFLFNLWLVLDDVGLATNTCIICSQVFNGGDDDDDPDTWTYTDDFYAMRVPLDQAWSVYSSLNEGGKELVDYMMDGPEPEGMLHWNPGFRTEITDLDVLDRKEIAWNLWRDQGVVD